MANPTFPFALEVDYENNIGRHCVTSCEGTYSFDGETAQIVTLSHNGSDYDESLIEELVYDQIDDQAHDDYAEWLAERGEYLADCAADARLVEGMPGVGA